MRKINSNVYIGGIDAGKRYHSDFDIVLNLSNEAYEHNGNVIHKQLADGHNEPEDFNEVVEIVKDALTQEKRILVHCQVGASRSVTVLSTALASVNETYFEDELYKCQMNGIHPSQELIKLAKSYLRES